MEKNQKVIVFLLILAILFSLLSIFISFSVSKIDLGSRSGVSGQASASGGGAGGVTLFVEERPEVSSGEN